MSQSWHQITVRTKSISDQNQLVSIGTSLRMTFGADQSLCNKDRTCRYDLQQRQVRHMHTVSNTNDDKQAQVN